MLRFISLIRELKSVGGVDHVMEGVSSSTLGNPMKKRFLIVATAAAFALPGPFLRCQAAPPQQASEHQQLSADQIAAFTDARIAALRPD